MLLQIHEPGETPLPHEGDEAVGIDLGTTNSLIAISRDEKPDIIGEMIPSIVDGISSIKRKMDAPSQLVEGRTPVEISSEILKKLIINAEQALDKEIKKAVITVPAYFDDTQRSATKDAAKLAGLDVLRLINEPTAAALAYGLDKDVEGVYAVYDLGGGTFDISILRMQKGVFQVLATGGDTALGGDDFDERIAESKGCDVAEARALKERGEFGDSLIEDLVDKTIEICAAALKDAELEKAQVNGVVMVGGSTRVELVQKKVEGFFGKAPLTDINPDEVVALGAAIQAEALTKGSNNLLLDVLPLSLGLETMHGIVEKVIHRNTPIPCSFEQEFTTFQNDQTGMIIHVVQGEREDVANCRSLAKFDLAGIPPMPAGVARIKVNFTVDADGILTVSAREEKTGTEQKVEVKPSYGLSDEQVEQMLRESMQNAKADMDERLLQEAKVEAERLLNSLKQSLERYELTETEKSVIITKVADLEAAISGADREQIDQLREELNELSGGLAQRIMDGEIKKALSGKKVDEV